MNTHDELKKMEEVRRVTQAIFDTMFSDSEYRLLVSPRRKDFRHDFGVYSYAVGSGKQVDLSKFTSMHDFTPDELKDKRCSDPDTSLVGLLADLAKRVKLLEERVDQ